MLQDSFTHDLYIHGTVQKGVILVSSELDELILLSDRIVVMYNGKFVGTIIPTFDDNRNELQEKEKQKLGALMLGLSIEE